MSSPVEVKQARSEDKVLELLKIDETDLPGQMAKQPNLFARFAFLAVRAEDFLERQKLVLKVKESELDSGIRQEIGKDKKYYAEAAVTARMTAFPGWQEAHKAVLKSKTNLDLLRAAVESFRMRAQMLSSLGAMKRQEMEQLMFLGTSTVNIGGEARKMTDTLKQRMRERLETGG